jgi:hypothetical protein
MKLISVDVARTTWLFPLAELNPNGRSMTQVFVDLKERYNFKKAPAHTLDFDPESKGLVFNEGEFVNHEGIRVLVKLTIFTDGVVSDAWSSTRDAEDFLEDAMEWITKQHGFSLPTDRRIKKLYLSQLTVSVGRGHIAYGERLEALAKILSAKLSETGRENMGFVAGGFSLWAADWDQPGAPAQYRFEIKAGSTPGENRHYASAPIPTDSHLALLEEQERLFG